MDEEKVDRIDAEVGKGLINALLHVVVVRVPADELSRALMMSSDFVNTLQTATYSLEVRKISLRGTPEFRIPAPTSGSFW